MFAPQALLSQLEDLLGAECLGITGGHVRQTPTVYSRDVQPTGVSGFRALVQGPEREHSLGLGSPEPRLEWGPLSASKAALGRVCLRVSSGGRQLSCWQRGWRCWREAERDRFKPVSGAGETQSISWVLAAWAAGPPTLL